MAGGSVPTTFWLAGRDREAAAEALVLRLVLLRLQLCLQLLMGTTTIRSVFKAKTGHLGELVLRRVSFFAVFNFASDKVRYLLLGEAAVCCCRNTALHLLLLLQRRVVLLHLRRMAVVLIGRKHHNLLMQL